MSTSRRSRSSPAWRAQQPLVLLVRHQVDPLAQLRARGEPRPVLDHHAVPARRLEHRLQPTRRDVGHDPVERLAVEVDDPHDLAELAHHRVGDRLPAGALVELRVADQRDLAPADRHVEVARDVAVRDRAPDRRRRAEPDRAGRVVDRVGVLRPRRVGLQPAELPQRRQVGAVEPPEQVVERVQDRRRVRLDADAVGRLQDAEPQRRHQRDHRRARGLVAADLHARAVRAHAVGVVDDRRRQPQHAPLHLVERREVELLLRGGRRCHCPGSLAARGLRPFGAMEEPVRVDKWLWAARLVKTRALAVEALKGGRVEVNGERAKPSKEVRPGDAHRAHERPAAPLARDPRDVRAPRARGRGRAALRGDRREPRGARAARGGAPARACGRRHARGRPADQARPPPARGGPPRPRLAGLLHGWGASRRLRQRRIEEGPDRVARARSGASTPGASRVAAGSLR